MYSSEECDTGNIGIADGCSDGCTIEGGYTCAGSPSVCTAVCGDGIIVFPETCDDFDTTSGDGCDSSC